MASKTTKKNEGQSTILAPTPDETILNSIKESISRRELITIIGTGVSVGLTNAKVKSLSWRGLIEDGFQTGLDKGRISEQQVKSWVPQLSSDDLDDLLGAAEFVSRKLDAPNGDIYARWMERAVGTVKPSNKPLERAVKAIYSAEVPLCTLNYDTLLEAVIGLPAINVNETGKVLRWARKELSGVFHLHGVWSEPKTCVLGIRDYETAIGDDVRNLIQRNLAAFRRLLFIGCGDTFNDPNFSALIRWLRSTLKATALEHYALVQSSEVMKRKKDPSWIGFVEPLGYGSHADLPAFLSNLFPTPQGTIAPTEKKMSGSVALRAADDLGLLQEYRDFLVKDCGQMTIEGVRADMEIGQRRFDLERLFVPLKLLALPPEIHDSDPKRTQKLKRWYSANNEPQLFGEVFAKHKHLALLALPGGGKTLLLKRLAVAYAYPKRRRASIDKLPELDVLPVMIRCREWREHLHRPIATLINSIPEITGKPTLKGLGDALLPLFKTGRVLLLIDGLDEIHDDALRSTFVEHLESFIEENKLTRTVVTSREAGFGLVAPAISRFCKRWRVAPLEASSIELLCDYWHRLIMEDVPEAQTEARDVARQLLRTNSLTRLAENPLLLTMLLVVKHGAGRLPPDRVSLYSRAVDVLLDTWNIKGHDPLSPKEAVPQLAFVALRLMRAGKQTATAKELLSILEEARDKVPQIRRYASDRPDEFLKRVELRSSLLVEAGHQIEDKQTVPFFQFRHLTFQEYLAAVAVSEGHYVEYTRADTVFDPLAKYFLADEWKEVVPMAAVLARKQADPLLLALVADGQIEQSKLPTGDLLSSDEESVNLPRREPPSVARLVQCFIEEAEASAQTLSAALRLIVCFAKGGQSAIDWSILSRGPYGKELLHQTWLVYAAMDWPDWTRLIETYTKFAVHRNAISYWFSEDGEAELTGLLTSFDNEDNVRGLFTIAGTTRPNIHSKDVRVDQSTTSSTSKLNRFNSSLSYLPEIERHLHSSESSVWAAASRAWGWVYRQFEAGPQPTSDVLDRLLTLWLSEARRVAVDRAAFALLYAPVVPRHHWQAQLSQLNIAKVREMANKEAYFDDHNVRTAYNVIFYNGSIWSDEELILRLESALRLQKRSRHEVEFKRVESLLSQIRR